MKRRYRLLVNVAGLTVVLFCPPISLPGERPDFTGHWRLNQQQSDDPQQKILAILDPLRNGNYRAHGTGFGSDVRETGVGPGPKETVLDAIPTGQMPPDRLFLELQGLQFRLKDGRGHSVTLFTDGRVQKFQRSQGTAELMTRWVNDELVTVLKAEGIVAVTTYTMARGGCRMAVETRTSTPQLVKPLVIRYVYDYDCPESICTLIPARRGQLY